MFETLSGLEILTIAVVALVVFGPNRLPEIARTIGRYVRELRAAVKDLREGIEREVAPLREPIKEIREDLAQPVSDVKRTLAETADAARSVEQDIKKSVESANAPAGPTPPATEQPDARWVAPEPAVGVSPGEVWEGLNDPLPENVIPPPPPAPTPDDGPATDPDDRANAGDESPDSGGGNAGTEDSAV